MKKRNDKIEKKYAEYNMKFARKSKEEMEASIKNLENQIEEKNRLLKETKDEGEREKIESVIKKMEQEKNNMSGYNKNKEKIEKIREYKTKLNAKIERLKQENAGLEKELKEHTEKNKDVLEYINKTLKDAKITEKMTNEEYNNLLEEKENIEKEKQEIQKKIDNVEKKIEALSRGVSKCDLAWRSLFNDKSWDEIHVRAVNARYTRKVKEPIQTKGNSIEKNDKIKTEPMSKATTSRGESNEYNKEESKELTTVSKFAEKHPRLAKFFNSTRNIGRKILKFFRNESMGKNIKENVVKSEEEKQMQPEIKEGRDAFIEELRRHVENDKGDKEAAYIEIHKAKSKIQDDIEIE